MATASPTRPEALQLVRGRPSTDLFATTAWHSLAWLVFANAVGVLLATLLLFPRLNGWLGEWSYGRWMPVHMNLQLYGWCSLPLVAFLFKLYEVDREPAAKWGRSVVWAWSTGLAVGVVSWLSGHLSGKLFLDWQGYARVVFPLAMLCLWLLLAWALRRHWQREPSSLGARIAKVFPLVLLLPIPLVLYIAAGPGTYPPVNPDSGGPTGASQLESVLIIVAILLLLPYGISRTRTDRGLNRLTWGVFVVESLLCLALGRANVSHQRPAQYLSLGSLLVWLPLMPLYYRSFEWRQNTKRWRVAWLCWWTILVPSGWCLFLPGVLDHFKFTDGLVGHSLLAMAGFVSSLLIFVMVVLLEEDARIFNRTWSFYTWQLSTSAYVLLMIYAGWIEGDNPAFAMVPGLARNVIYFVRLGLGVLLLAASLDWLFDCSRLLRERQHNVSASSSLPAHAESQLIPAEGLRV